MCVVKISCHLQRTPHAAMILISHLPRGPDLNAVCVLRSRPQVSLHVRTVAAPQRFERGHVSSPLEAAQER